MNPGNGYRLLEPNEIRAHGDEYWAMDGKWCPTTACIGDPAGHSEVPVRRRIRQVVTLSDGLSLCSGTAWRFLDVGETIQKGDEYWSAPDAKFYETANEGKVYHPDPDNRVQHYRRRLPANEVVENFPKAPGMLSEVVITKALSLATVEQLEAELRRRPNYYAPVTRPYNPADYQGEVDFVSTPAPEYRRLVAGDTVRVGDEHQDGWGLWLPISEGSWIVGLTLPCDYRIRRRIVWPSVPQYPKHEPEYRLLVVGELLRAGDEWRYKKDAPQGAWQLLPSYSVGLAFGDTLVDARRRLKHS